MIWALKDNEKIRAIPNERALCPTCREEVISKCGNIKIWHWSHKADNDCDSWSEGETEWHSKWKNEFPKEMQEVVVGEHRADIKLPSGKVIELQNSSISVEDIEKRENYYAEMIWLLNGDTFAKNIELRKKDKYFTFIWKWFPKSLSFVKKTIYIDLQFLADRYQKELDKIKHRDDSDTYVTVSSYTYWEEYADGESYPKTGYSHDERTFGSRKKELQVLIYNYTNTLLLVKKIYADKNPVTGWGFLMRKEDFLKQL
jgi:competence CoiA-like predicted nuclease